MFNSISEPKPVIRPKACECPCGYQGYSGSYVIANSSKSINETRALNNKVNDSNDFHNYMSVNSKNLIQEDNNYWSNTYSCK